jgi:hypothetical protein
MRFEPAFCDWQVRRSRSHDEQEQEMMMEQKLEQLDQEQPQKN